MKVSWHHINEEVLENNLRRLNKNFPRDDVVFALFGTKYSKAQLIALRAATENRRSKYFPSPRRFILNYERMINLINFENLFHFVWIFRSNKNIMRLSRTSFSEHFCFLLRLKRPASSDNDSVIGI